MDPDKNGKTLKYIQLSLANDNEIHELLDLVLKTSRILLLVPYTCIAGMAGINQAMPSALILMQFAGFSNADALKYWEKCAFGRSD